MRALRVAAMVLTAIGMVSIGWTASMLHNGLVELRGHWWLALAALPLLAGLVLAAAAWGAPRLRRSA